MFNPPHPGESTKEDILPAPRLAVTNGSWVEIRLGMQMDCDLWVSKQKPALKVTRTPDFQATRH